MNRAGQVGPIIAAAALLIAESRPSRGQTAPDCACLSFHLQLEKHTARIPAGLEVPLTVTAAIQSGKAKSIDLVELAVARDVRGIDGQTVIPAGTRAVGHVVDSRGGGAFGREGALSIALDAVELPSGIRVPIRPAGDSAKLSRRGRSRTGEAVATGLLVGLAAALAVGVAELGDRLSSGSRSSSAVPTIAFALSAATTAALWRGSSAEMSAGQELAAVVAEDTLVALESSGSGPPSQRPNVDPRAPVDGESTLVRDARSPHRASMPPESSSEIAAPPRG